MRDHFPGHYRASEEEVQALWREGLVVPDTSALLALYRLPDRSRDKLLEILGRLREQLFVPHQVALEFQRNRASVIEEQERAYEDASREVGRLAARVGGGMRRHPRLEKTDLERRIEEALAPVLEHLQSLRDDHPAPLTGGDPLGADSVRDALDRLFAGRIGPVRDLEGVVEEGRARYAKKRPPGHLDEKKKPEPDRYGDLAIWLDVLEAAKEREVAVIIVTEERKADWWWKDEHDQLLAPRPELVEEMAAASGGRRLHLKSLDRFMEEAAGALRLDFSEAEREEVLAARPSEPIDPSGLEWKIDHELRERAQRELDPDLWVHRGQTGFFASPASGQTHWGPPRPAGFPPSPDAAPGWRGAVRTVGRWAELEIHWEPRPGDLSQGPFGQLRCIVTAPQGESASAVDSGGELSAYLRFPDDFRPLLHPLLGTYGFAWFFEAPGQQGNFAIGHGAFVLEDPTGAAG
jgi:hypothetical protein